MVPPRSIWLLRPLVFFVFFVFNVFFVFFVFVCSWLCQRCQGHLVVLESMGSQGLHFSTFLKEDSRGIAGCLLQSVDSHALAIPPSAFFTFLYVYFESTS